MVPDSCAAGVAVGAAVAVAAVPPRFAIIGTQSFPEAGPADGLKEPAASARRGPCPDPGPGPLRPGACARARGRPARRSRRLRHGFRLVPPPGGRWARVKGHQSGARRDRHSLRRIPAATAATGRLVPCA